MGIPSALQKFLLKSAEFESTHPNAMAALKMAAIGAPIGAGALYGDKKLSERIKPNDSEIRAMNMAGIDPENYDVSTHPILGALLGTGIGAGMAGGPGALAGGLIGAGMGSAHYFTNKKDKRRK